VRMVVQLAIMGAVLTTLFALVSPLWTGLAAFGMALFAGREIAQRQKRPFGGLWSFKAATGKTIHLILGGTHLVPAKDDQIKSIAASFHDNWKVAFIAPVHCTGEPAFAILKDTFGDKYVYAGLGSTVVLGPQVIFESRSGTPCAAAAIGWRSCRDHYVLYWADRTAWRQRVKAL